MQRPRYALYFVPGEPTEFHELGARWLGRDAYSSKRLASPPCRRVSEETFLELTSKPRRYGFHATMRAPFELLDGSTETDLARALHELCTSFSPFEISVSPQIKNNNLVLQLDDPSELMDLLHRKCLQSVEAFRAVPSPAYLARRRRANLSANQDKLLLKWGYPYVLDEFDWHMTLSSIVSDHELLQAFYRDAVDHFHSIMNRPQIVDSMTLCRQASQDMSFEVMEQRKFS